MMRGILSEHIPGRFARRAAPSLGELISSMVDSFSERDIDSEAVSLPLRFMHDSGLLEDKTMELLAPLLAMNDLRAVEFLEDGRVRYRSNSVLWDDREYAGDAELLCFDPVKTVSWLVRALQDDRKLKAALGFRPGDLNELIGAASEISTGDYGEYASSLDRFRGPRALCGSDLLFFFTDDKRSKALYFDKPENLRFSPGIGTADLISSGMAGEIVRSGSDLYFRYNGACAYLHIDVKTADQEILQGICIVGAVPRGGIVFKDVEEDSLCFMKDDEVKTLLKGTKDLACRLEEDYIIVSSSNGSILPYRLSYDGTKSPASPGEISAVFWSAMMSLAAERSYALSLNANRSRWEFIREAENSSLCLKDMNRIFSKAFEKRLFSRGTAFPTRDILKLIESLGIGPEEDISAQMFTLFRYNYLCGKGRFFDHPDVFSRSYLGLLSRLSRKPRFWERLTEEPEKLFKNQVKKQLEEHVNIFDLVLGESDLIGNVTLLPDGSLKAVKRSRDLGRVENGKLVLPEDCGAAEEGIRGRVCFDLEKGDYILCWPSPDDELVSKVSALFMHNSPGLRPVDTDAPLSLPFDEDESLEELRRMLRMEGIV
ncbi:MAG: hypothetical protein IJM17_09055 [Firmicutes bacterium]|nr:hypothetical protein [Bacillota bacterium]